jgi:hypothetical protein
MTPIFFQFDLSQVEARVELLLAASTPEFTGTDVAKECVRLATAHPSEFDIHTWSASVALAKSETDIRDTDEHPERFTGKTTMHGFMRGMGAQRLSDTLLVRGYVVTPEECERRIGRLIARLPAIQDGFFVDVRRQIMRYRGLGTTWGAIWRCDGYRLDDSLYGTGYSYQPQRETIDLLNQQGLLPLRNAVQNRTLALHAAPKVHIHGHDSLTMSIDPRDAFTLMEFIEQSLALHKRHYAAAILQVPVGYGLGENGKMRYEFKRLPAPKDALDAAMDCAARVGS